MEISDMESLG